MMYQAQFSLRKKTSQIQKSLYTTCRVLKTLILSSLNIPATQFQRIIFVFFLLYWEALDGDVQQNQVQLLRESFLYYQP